MKWTYKAKRFLLDLAFPNSCPICNEFIEYDKFICEKCIEKLPIVKTNKCNRCNNAECTCTDLYYDKCFSFVYYEDSGKKGLLSFKLEGIFNFAEYISFKAIDKLSEQGLLSKIDIITCVPMSAKKERVRGYNQAYDFAKMISRLSKLPLHGKLLVKEKSKIIQHELSAEQRRIKAYEAFALKAKPSCIQGKTILLCDDVVTTGSTLDACAKLLKEAGAKAVYCITIATTRFTDKNKPHDA